jgi:hypothetical protein
MAKSETVSVEVDTDREKRWSDILIALEKQNPAAFAARKESGEFESIPASFV